MRCGILVGIVRAFDPGSWIDRPNGRFILSKDRFNGIAPYISTRAQMSKDIIDRSLTWIR